MNPHFAAEELDRQVDSMLAAGANPEIEFGSLHEIAARLRRLPSADFKQRLRTDLLASVEPLSPADNAELRSACLVTAPQLMPTFLQHRELSMLPADPRSLVFSFLSHAAVVVLIASGIWLGHGVVVNRPKLISDLTFTPLPAGIQVPHGGGSGGDHSSITASRGTPPKFSDEQLTPPAIVVRNPVPKLQVDPTLLGPPQLKLPQSNQIGDLLSTNVTIPSNGTGGNAGIGSNHGTGIGPGGGPGFGPGTGGGCCTGTYRPGNGVSAPRAIYDPDPEYSEEARKAKFGGIVVLSVTVDPSGRPRDIRVARSLGMGLDEKAVEAVEKWKFTPGMKDGMPVAVQVNVEVSFRLY